MTHGLAQLLSVTSDRSFERSPAKSQLYYVSIYQARPEADLEVECQ